MGNESTEEAHWPMASTGGKALYLFIICSLIFNYAGSRGEQTKRGKIKKKNMKDTIQREAKPWAQAKAETLWCFPPFVQNDSKFSVV